MFEREGEVLALLERMIRRELDGDNDKNHGLYRNLVACQDWDSFNQSKGRIQGYENVLKMMDVIARQIHAEEGPRRAYS